MAIKVGDKAPSFTLVSGDKTKVTLDQFAGKKVVLLFFSFAFSEICNRELELFQAELKKFKDLNVQILAISVDSPFCLKKMQETIPYTFPMLSDFNKEISRAYDVLYDSYLYELKEVAKRSIFVIDQDGIIRYTEVFENTDQMPDLPKLYMAIRNC